MAVNSSTLVSTRGQVATNNQSRFTLRYHVKSDRNMTAEEVYNGALIATPDPIPANYSALSTNPSLYCQRASIEQFSDEECAHWYIDAEFSALPAGETEDSNKVDPAERPIKIRLDFEPITAEVNEDVNGDAILNGLNEPFPDPITTDKHLPILLVERYVRDLTVVLDIQETYENTVNNGTVLGRYDAGQVRYDGIASTSELQENGFTYVEVTIRLAINKEGWAIKKLNEGLVFEDDDGNIRAAEDDAGQFTSSVVYLDENNKKVALPSDASELTFDVLPQVDYSPLFL